MERKTVDCGMYIKKIDGILQKRANELLGANNLTGMQAHALMELYQAENQTLALKQMESLFDVAQSTVVGIVMRLERKGLVEKLEDASDRRVKRVRLTDAGRSLCADSRRNIDETEQWLLSRLDERERAEFLRLLKKVYETIR